MAKTIYILNGPNLNLLGTREPDKYGHTTLADLEATCRATADAHDCDIVFRQSNLEGDLVGWIQEARTQGAAGIVLNAAGYTTTSVSILDALLAVKLPVVEVHITNIHAREEFRHNSLVSRAATGLIAGFGVASYTLAIEALAGIIRAQADRKDGKRDGGKKDKAAKKKK
ncbi:MAG TPA: type II 3-dehydroquinate dehydratase [Pseudolabrys sp.]|nr:type II 3-dehydroquinate dehydratase [Pseudolabrys sp.]